MNLSPQDIVDLPFHDAHILDLDIRSDEGGFFTAIFRVLINEEETLEPFRKFGITSRRVCIVFEECWEIKVDLLGTADKREVISEFEIEENSGLKSRLLGWGVGARAMVHLRIEGSNGSLINVVTNRVTLSQAGTP